MQQMLEKSVSRVQFTALRCFYESFLSVRSCFIIIIRLLENKLVEYLFHYCCVVERHKNIKVYVVRVVDIELEVI